jgi:hypothetical protein
MSEFACLTRLQQYQREPHLELCRLRFFFSYFAGGVGNDFPLRN